MEMSQNNDKEKDNNEEEDGVDLSHIDEKIVLEPNRVELTTGFSQRDEGQLLKVVKREETHAKDDEEHCDEVLEECQVEEELLEHLLKEPEYEDVIEVSGKGVSQVLIETEMYVSFQVHDVLASTEERLNEYVTVIRELEDILPLEGKFEGLKQ
jgi:hypothetical protein